MAKLIDLAQTLRSKNAGPLFITFDILFAERRQLEAVLGAQILTDELISRIYGVPAESVRIIPYPVVNALKITITRLHISGDVLDCDVYGCQQHLPLADVLFPDDLFTDESTLSAAAMIKSVQP